MRWLKTASLSEWWKRRPDDDKLSALWAARYQRWDIFAAALRRLSNGVDRNVFQALCKTEESVVVMPVLVELGYLSDLAKVVLATKPFPQVLARAVEQWVSTETNKARALHLNLSACLTPEAVAWFMELGGEEHRPQSSFSRRLHQLDFETASYIAQSFRPFHMKKLHRYALEAYREKRDQVLLKYIPLEPLVNIIQEY